MIRFRGSSTGYCTRKLVLSHLQPELVKVPVGRQPFLNAGHNLQEAVEDFLTDFLPADWRLLSEWRESRCEIVADDWKVVGHVDGVLERESTGTRFLLEVKAVKEANFKKIVKAQDWRDPYASYGYESQAQTYLEAMDLPATAFVFYNRNTSEMMGPWDIDHELWAERPDMIERRSFDAWIEIAKKLDHAANLIVNEDVPDECDGQGYCFFCGTQGSKMKVHNVRRIEIDAVNDEADHEWFTESLSAFRRSQAEMLDLFTEFSADEIIVDGETYKRADYA